MGQRPSDVLLPRLDKVRERGVGRWSAICPAHEDRSPSLSVREVEDGRLLVYCFAGCEAGDVLAAVGLEMADLFPERPREHTQGRLPPRERFEARDLLAVASGECSMVALIALGLEQGGYPLAPWARKALLDAESRLAEIARMANA